MNEIWKDIPGFEQFYQVSNLGRVRSKDHIRNNHYYKGKIRKPQNNGHGYLFVMLSINGKHYQRYVHRLVAKAFIPNIHNYSEINHKDEDPSNNKATNLEWCTPKQNSNYGNHRLHLSQSSKQSEQKHIACINNGMKTAKPVIQLTLNGKVVKCWESMEQAAKQGGFSTCNIRQCCNGQYKQHKGYKWKFA